MCYEIATSIGGTGRVGNREKIFAGGPAHLIVDPEKGARSSLALIEANLF
jgi:hypothetical protein